MVDLVAVLHHTLVEQCRILDLPPDLRVDHQLTGSEDRIHIGVHFFRICYTEQHIAICIVLAVGQAQIRCIGILLLHQSQAAKMEVEQRIYPRLALILILLCQICPAGFCRLHKKMTADIGRHLLTQQGQCLLIHAVFCAPAYQRRKIVFGGSQQTFKFCAEAVIQQVEEQAGQIFALLGRRLQCLCDLAQVFIQRLHPAQRQVIRELVDAGKQGMQSRVALALAPQIAFQLLCSAGGKELVHGRDEVEQAVQLTAVMDAGSAIRKQFGVDHPAGLHTAQVTHTASCCYQKHRRVPHAAGKINGEGIFRFNFSQQQRDSPELCLVVHAVRYRDHHKPLCRNARRRQEYIPEIFHGGAGFPVRQMHGRAGAHQLTAQCQNTVQTFLVLFQLQNRRFIGLGMNVRIFAEGAHI